MTTTDSMGILYLEATDNITPFATTVNALQSATSNAVKKATRGPLYAANNTERNALLSQYGSSASNPLWVDVAGDLYRHAGSSWELVSGPNIGRAYTHDNTGGGTLTTTWALSTSPASLTLPQGSYVVYASIAFTLSLAATVNLQAHLFDSAGNAFGTSQDSYEYRYAASVGTASFTMDFTRHITVPSGGRTVQIRRRTSATGGTQSSGTEHLTALRVK